METNPQSLVVKRVVHPFQCRLPPNTNFAKDDPVSLVGTGFISIALAIFTAFRMTPAILLTLLFNIRLSGESLNFFSMYGPTLIYSWLALIFLTLVVGGAIMACSRRIRKRSILLFQPWALLLLYFDGFLWLSITLYLHTTLNQYKKLDDGPTKIVPYPIASFTFIYLDIALFMVVHFAFASYYITAQITTIENCF